MLVYFPHQSLIYQLLLLQLLLCCQRDYCSYVILAHALSHALATTVLAELSQGCNVPNKINGRGEEKSGLLEDKNFKPYWLETNIVHMQDIRKKISL